MSEPDEAPPDPLADAENAIARGDLVEARRIARERSASEDAETRARARQILARLAPDPVVLAVLFGTGIVIAVLAMLYLHAH